MFDVSGSVAIVNCAFIKNNVPIRELRRYFGGGGISLEFTYCTPGVVACNQSENIHNKNNTCIIKDCVFNNNRATNDEITAQIHNVQFRNLTGNDGNNAGQGGGIHITIKGTGSDNSIIIVNCSFHNNSAKFGGGVDAVIQDDSVSNSITISHCTFANNSALERSGGAVTVGFTSGSRVLKNSIRIEDTAFTNNIAGRGGAVSFFSSRVSALSTNSLEFVNCTWVGNSASIGAAVSLRPIAGSSHFDGEPPIPLFQMCTFARNNVIKSAAFLTSANDGKTQHVVDTGALHIESIKVQLKDIVYFNENIGSAIVATSSQINVFTNSKVYFVQNMAENGGAIALLGFSVLELYTGSQVIFDSNMASELGGAVYSTSSDMTEFVFSHTCFFSHKTYSHPDYWNTSLTFTNNTARYGNDIYADSLLPCAKSVFDIVTNVSATFRWNPFVYIEEINNSTIATSPATINFSLPNEIAPGEKINLHPVSLDDLGRATPSVYQVFLFIRQGNVSTNRFLSDDGYIQIKGLPGSKFELMLRTQNTRPISLSKTGRIGNCPLGLLFHGNSCVCSAQTPNRHLLGIVECDMSAFRAIIGKYFWIGCSESGEVSTGYCTLGYCKPQFLDTETFSVPRSCNSSKINFPCASHRRGRLCGECEKGYTVYFHSYYFICGTCSHGAFGLLIYVVAELIPVFLLFSTIMIMKIKVTSGPMQSVIFFAQVVTLTSPISAGFDQYRIYSVILGVLRLDILTMDELSFCLWEGATVLDNLLFRYLTTLFTLFLITAYILAARHNVRDRLVCFKKLRGVIRQVPAFHSAVIHGISTFLILTYTQLTITSFQILSRLLLYGEGGKVVGSVVRLQGNVDYFGADHLPYAIPALLVLVFLSLPPPLLLISYPLLWKIKARLMGQSGNDRTVWLIWKLLPLIDSFQGVFRDNCHYYVCRPALSLEGHSDSNCFIVNHIV